MALVERKGGCKVGWETYDDEAEAREAAQRAAVERDRKFGLGYDFGYLWPGSIQETTHPEHGKVWVVTVP